MITAGCRMVLMCQRYYRCGTDPQSDLTTGMQSPTRDFAGGTRLSRIAGRRRTINCHVIATASLADLPNNRAKPRAASSPKTHVYLLHRKGTLKAWNGAACNQNLDE